MTITVVPVLPAMIRIRRDRRWPHLTRLSESLRLRQPPRVRVVSRPGSRPLVPVPLNFKFKFKVSTEWPGAGDHDLWDAQAVGKRLGRRSRTSTIQASSRLQVTYHVA
jgi:hypothetical protein